VGAPGSGEPQPPPGDRRRGILRAIEEAPGGGWGWFLLLAGLIFARHLLEGFVEAPQQMGFDWRGDVSVGMLFLHFPLFYLALFLLLTLWLHILAGRPASRVARVVVCGFGLLLVVPIVDHFASRGAGYDLKYLTGFGAEVWRFWDPRAASAAVSPGQRIEIALAALLCGGYAGAARRASGAARALGLGLLCAAGAYGLIALLGAWPALFARATLPGAADAAAAYLRAFQLQGLVAEESRRLALVMALPALAALPLFLWRVAPGPFGALARRMIGLRLAHYTGMAPAGALLGWIVYREHLPAFANPVDFAAVAVVWAAMTAAFAAAVLWNDLYDREADRWNDPGRPLPSGALGEPQARKLAAACALAAVYLALCAGYAPMLLMIACLWLSWLYSAPPVRLKARLLLATLTLALLSLISLAAGFALFAQEMTPRVLPGRMAALLLLGITLGFTAKDLRDAEGDRRSGTTTLATLLPPRAARRVTAALVALGFLLAPLCLPIGWVFAATAAACAALGAALTLRRPRPDGPLLALFLLFALLLLAFLGRRPELLRERLPAELSGAPGGAGVTLVEIHGRVRRAEEEARLIRRVREAGGDPGALLAGVSPPAAEVAAGLGRLLSIAPGRWEERLRWARAQVSPPRRASEDFDRLTAMRPLRAAYLEAALASAEAGGDLAGARRIAERALASGVRPGDFSRHGAALAIAEATEAGGGGERAAESAAGGHLRGAFLFGQEEPALWALLGDLRLLRGETRAAQESFRRALFLDRASADGRSGLGRALHAGGDAEGAATALSEAVALAPQDPWVRNNLGVALRDCGRWGEAIAQFEAARALAPDLFEPLYNLGVLHERLGRRDEARAWYVRAQELRPGFPPLEEALARVGAGEASPPAVIGGEARPSRGPGEPAW